MIAAIAVAVVAAAALTLAPALLAVAAKVGTTRLIDNLPLVVGPGGGERPVVEYAD